MSVSVVYVTPASSLHGGIRIIFEHAEGLAERGYEVTVVGPEPPPEWHPFRVAYRQVDLRRPGAVPSADVAVGTFWTTVEPARDSGSGTVFHLCQGFEGVHREYAPILDQIDRVYRLPIPKLLISAHLEPILRERYGCRCHVLGQAVNTALFHPAEPAIEPSWQRSLRVGFVGPFGIRSKNLHGALEAAALARSRGLKLEVLHAAAEPMAPAEREMGVTDRYFERLSTTRMPVFYRELDAFLQVSYDEEGFPLPTLEAMACGTAVAVSEIGYTSALPAEAALRFPPGDVEAMARTLERLAAPELRRSLGAAGLACARQHTLERVLDRLEAAFGAEGVAVGGCAPGAR